MGLSKLAAWNTAWLVLFAALAAGGLWFTTLSPSRERLEYSDWPDDGDTSHANRWRGGVFLDLPAERIRRLGIYRGDHLDAKSVSFFVSVPMAQPEFERRLRDWQTRPDFDARRFDGMFSGSPPHLPDWFPRPSSDIYVGQLTDESNWRIRIFRRPNDQHLYLRL